MVKKGMSSRERGSMGRNPEGGSVKQRKAWEGTEEGCVKQREAWGNYSRQCQGDGSMGELKKGVSSRGKHRGTKAGSASRGKHGRTKAGSGKQRVAWRN